MRKYGGRDNWSPEGLALHLQGVIQGAFILAKAKGSAAVAAESLDHLRRYLELPFSRGSRRSTGRRF
jgi:TetR/AcrR family transcriptional regulator, transcriptional repressor for nem operon